jgi:hypothetical protein
LSFGMFSASFFRTIRWYRITNWRNVPFLPQRTSMIRCLLLCMALSAIICTFKSRVGWSSWYVSTNFGTCSCQLLISTCSQICLLFNGTVSIETVASTCLQILKCNCVRTLSWCFIHFSFAKSRHPSTFLLSHQIAGTL